MFAEIPAARLSRSKKWIGHFVLALFTLFLASCAGHSLRSHCPGPDGCGRVDLREAEGVQSTGRLLPEDSLNTLPFSSVAREHPTIGRLKGHGSLSIGRITRGILVNGAMLDLKGEHHQVLETQAQRQLVCGTDELVAVIEKSAKKVAKAYPGAVLTVGNIGRCGGGPIPYSVSHNSGRDADIGFYLLGPDGKQYIPKGLVKLDSRGTAIDNGVPVRFDTKKNWALVKTLLSDSLVSVQWLFVSKGLRKLLLKHAEAIGEPADLIAKAGEVLAQPARSSPHNDHFHLRIYCSADDQLEGCVDFGSNRSWYAGPNPKVSARIKELIRLSRSNDPKVRRDTAIVLGRMEDEAAQNRIFQMLSDKDEAVVHQAAIAIKEYSAPTDPDRIIKVLLRHESDTVAGHLFKALTAFKRRTQTKALLKLLASGRQLEFDMEVFKFTSPVRDVALDRLCKVTKRKAAITLAGALSMPGVDVAAIDDRLRILTGMNPDTETESDMIRIWQESTGVSEGNKRWFR
jgi:penicillin-insensitive murein endopeptidase